ncbi:Glutathione S-transferase theta-2 [Holothuria leucospilota]|uniref:Glutathione S-transferase theta-2 n=1 Tax=Holothuria leucospilota TaxID=206669 RepID=A0A9Q1CCN2_HOLLE|nr:Glutathione S-transferase theta-2 [Holothuria leucospilota]
MTLQFYYHPLSMPSRSVRLFLKKTGIQVEEIIIDLAKREQHSPEFLKINPRHCVPVIVDGDFILTEGIAILCYLIEKFPDKVADHWYPKDLRKRARVNEYLSYHDGSTRQLFSRVFQDEYWFWDKKVTDEERKNHIKDMLYVATQLQDTFLKDKQYLCGDEISIADLMAISEVSTVKAFEADGRILSQWVKLLLNVMATSQVIQPTIGRPDTTKEHPKLAEWLERVKTFLKPEFDEVYEPFYEVRKEAMSKKK